MHTIWIGDQLVAEATTCLQLEMPGDGMFGSVDKLSCYYFPKIKLTPIVLFEHLSGVALLQFLDHSTLISHDKDRIEGLRYVHGRSETMRGSSKISSVLLVKPSEVPSDSSTWFTYLPAIYEKFLGMTSERSETP